MLKTTALNTAHKALGARMVDFGGWDMPVIYSNQIEEHYAVREKAGIFDVSHMGEIMVVGPDAFKLVQKLVTKDISKMKPGRVSLGVMCTETGGIIDDLTVYKYDDERYMLVVNAGTREKDAQWCRQNAQGMDVQIEDISDDVTKIDIQGPLAEKVLAQLTDADLPSIKRYWFKTIKVGGVEMTVSRSGYTGEDGFELYLPNAEAENIWHKLIEVGTVDGLIPCGLGARDTLRTECGMMLYGHDINTETTPLEAVYGWAVCFDKEFIGKEALLKQMEEGLTKKLVGFEILDRGIAREHYAIHHNGAAVGEVTSGTPSPTLGKNIGMGYVPYALREPGTEIEIEVRGRMLKAVVVKLPFYKP